MVLPRRFNTFITYVQISKLQSHNFAKLRFCHKADSEKRIKNNFLLTKIKQTMYYSVFSAIDNQIQVTRNIMVFQSVLSHH